MITIFSFFHHPSLNKSEREYIILSRVPAYQIAQGVGGFCDYLFKSLLCRRDLER